MKHSIICRQWRGMGEQGLGVREVPGSNPGGTTLFSENVWALG